MSKTLSSKARAKIRRAATLSGTKFTISGKEKTRAGEVPKVLPLRLSPEKR